ncbi:hypothetical protein [Alteromonas facilis]|uniref:hypothetical protein n=1 Tax=Alteromonas facilis TaxID=2048004 RepID=UPI000C28BE9A|nr:hypothetical protein [Alteromonas facilis]
MNEIFTIKSSNLWTSLSTLLMRGVLTEDQQLDAERFTLRCEKNNWTYETLGDGESIRVLGY